MASPESPIPKIPVHQLDHKSLKDFDYKLYHLKGNYSMNQSLSFMPGDTDIPHRHNYHEICFFSNGKGIHEIDFKKIDIKPYSIHFVGAGQVHQITSSQDVTGRVLAFPTDILWKDVQGMENVIRRYPFINPMNNVPSLDLKQEEFESIIRSIENLSEDGVDWKSRSKFVIQHHIRIILEKCNYYLSRFYKDTNGLNPLQNTLISQYRNLVESHFRDIHQVQDYSQLLNITPGHLNRYCKVQTGFTASEIILDRILLEAKRLLLFTDQSSKRIAYYLNFEDPSYFSRFFKSKTGYSPLSYRNHLREKYHQ